MKTQKVKQILLGLIVPVLILAAWICATHFGNIPTSILPKISMVWQAFLEMLRQLRASKKQIFICGLAESVEQMMMTPHMSAKVRHPVRRSPGVR